MTLYEVMQWLKTFDIFQYYYVGKINGQQQQVLGVYARGEAGNPVHALGEPSKYQINGVKLLVHWNKDQQLTQNASNQLFSALTDVTDVDFGDNHIYYVDLLNTEPVNVGTDANDICEYVINIDIYSRRRM